MTTTLIRATSVFVSLKDLVDAINFAAEKHSGQLRKDKQGTPYINHPLALVNILAVECNITNLHVLKAAVLHDTVEDTDATIEELGWNFGGTVAGIVEEMSDDKELDKLVRKQLQITNAAGATYLARVTKLADKIANLRDIAGDHAPSSWDLQRKQEYFDWAKDVVDELRGTDSQLESLFDDVYALRSTLT